MSYPDILYGVADRIATITLNRPDRLNAYTDRMASSIRLAMADAARDPTVRVIVLTGAGRGFCAGADMDLLQGIQQEGGERAASRGQGDVGDAFDSPYGPKLDDEFADMRRFAYFMRTKKPIVAAINGPAAGIGLIMTLYADVRFVSDKAVLTTSFAQRGLIAEHGISWLLPRLVGHANALDLLLSARRVSSDEALRMGLVNRLYPADRLREETFAYARDLADFVSPSSMAVIKRQLYDVPFQTLSEAMIDANREMLISLRGADFKEGVASFVEKRAPRFTGR